MWSYTIPTVTPECLLIGVAKDAMGRFEDNNIAHSSHGSIHTTDSTDFANRGRRE